MSAHTEVRDDQAKELSDLCANIERIDSELANLKAKRNTTIRTYAGAGYPISLLSQWSGLSSAHIKRIVSPSRPPRNLHRPTYIENPTDLTLLHLIDNGATYTSLATAYNLERDDVKERISNARAARAIQEAKDAYLASLSNEQG